MTLFLRICFFLYFLKLSAGRGFFQRNVFLYLDVDCASAMRGHKARLIHDLLDGYDPDARPEKDDSYPSEPTVVRFSITYNQLQHLVSTLSTPCLLPIKPYISKIPTMLHLPANFERAGKDMLVLNFDHT